MLERVWLEDMGEISGFGGGYEATCRAMVLAGMQWIDQHPDADVKFQGSPQIFGVIVEDSEDAKALTEAVIAASGGDATGAMHHASINHVMAYKRLGWDEYCRQLRERESEDAASA